MDRARFAQRAELVVDVCAAHGIWLDAGELPMVLAYVKERTSGHVVSSAAEREDREQWDRLDRLHAEEAAAVAMHTARAESASAKGSPSAATVVAATMIAGPWAGLFFALRGLNKNRKT